METIDLTPSPEAYRQMLRLIILSGALKDREWALKELERIKNVKEWNK